MKTKSTVTTQSVTPGPALERLPQVLRRVGVSRSEWYRQIAVGTAPKPVKIGARASAWSVDEINRWILGRIDARDGDAK